MPSTDVSLAWALPVRVEDFGGSFEACVRLQPVFTALRLCNRFGKGDDVHVTRLPAELTAAIEEYLMQQERQDQQAAWAKDYKCWKATCTLTDHSTPEECTAFYMDMLDDFEFGDNQPKPIVGKKLTPRQMSEVEHFRGVEDSEWYYEHEDRRERWQVRTGGAAASDQGLFTQHKELIRTHFGLDVWVSHTQLEDDKEAQRADEGIRSSTLAYLKAPGGRGFTKSFHRRVKDDDDLTNGPQYLPMEVGCALPIAIPSPLSAKTLKCFERAMTIMDLQPLQEEKSILRTPSDDSNDKDGNSSVSRQPSDSGNDDAQPQATKPALMFLVRNKDQADDLNHY